MSREDQIDKMSYELMLTGKSLDTVYPDDCEKIAAILYDVGCRMQSEEEKPMFENTRNILHHLKRQIHDKAVYPHNAGIDAYITLKAFDAILQNYLNDLK